MALRAPLLLLLLLLLGPAATLGEPAESLEQYLLTCNAENERLAKRVEELEAHLAFSEQRIGSFLAGSPREGLREPRATATVEPSETPTPPEDATRRLKPWTRPWYRNCLCAVFCVMLGGTAAGLTMGMVSIEPMEMEIIVKTEEKDMLRDSDRQKLKEDQMAAYSLLPLIQDHHRLLVSLLVLNSLASEALPLFLDSLVPSWLAIILSVTLVVMFGEIIPSAIFTGSEQLRIAAKFAPLVTGVLCLLAPISIPIAKALDHLLGEDHKGRYNFAELRAIVGIHARLNTDGDVQHVTFKSHDDEERGIITTEQPHHFTSDSVVVFTSAPNIPAKSTKLRADGRGYFVKPCLPISGRDTGRTFKLFEQHRGEDSPSGGPITFKHGELTSGIFKMQERDELKIMHGVMNLTHMTASDALKPLSETWMLELKQRLTLDLMKQILNCGYSRIPVYDTNKHNLRGFILVKRLIVLSPEADGGKGHPVDSVDMETMVVVPPNIPMLELLNKFQEDKTHMALVTNAPQAVAKAWKEKKAIPPDVHMAGIITLEDVIEKLLQEDIDDEHDALCQTQTLRNLELCATAALNPATAMLPGAMTPSTAISTIVAVRRLAGRIAERSPASGSTTQGSDSPSKQASAPVISVSSRGPLGEPLLSGSGA